MHVCRSGPQGAAKPSGPPAPCWRVRHLRERATRARYASEKITTTSYVVSLRWPGSLLPTETRSFAPPPRGGLAFCQDGGAYPRLWSTLSCETCCFNVKSLLPRLQAQVDPRRIRAPNRRSLSPKLVQVFLGKSAVAISGRPPTNERPFCPLEPDRPRQPRHVDTNAARKGGKRLRFATARLPENFGSPGT